MSEDEYTELMRNRGVEMSEPAPKPSKYHSNRVKVDGILFDSQKEADYYSDLKVQQRAGTIKGFCRQPEFILLAGFAKQRPETYRADFIVFHLDDNSIPLRERERWIPEYLKIARRLNEIVTEIRKSGRKLTNKQIMEGI
jgi:hypothetical protein